MDFSSSSSSSSAFNADNALKILTPFWDVVLRYITNVIMVIAFGSLPIQAAKDTLACVVVVNCPNTTTASPAMKQLDGTGTCEVLNQVALSTFLNQACYYTLNTTESFFVVVLCGEAFVLLLSSSIWSALYPKSSLTLGHFITVVSECYDCVGTDQQGEELTPGSDSSSSLLDGLDNPSKAKIKTIHYKVKKFCEHQKKKKSLFYLYLVQQGVQVFFSFTISFINLVYFRSFNEKFRCSLPADEFLPIQYNYISCYRYIIPFYEIVSHIFTGFVIFYCVFAVGVFCFIVYKMNTYADKWDQTSDLDFLCILLRQYSSNQYERFEQFKPKDVQVLLGQHPSLPINSD